MELEVCIL